MTTVTSSSDAAGAVAGLAEEPRTLRSYRRARTYPKTIRKLANLDLPYPVTIPQLAVWVGVFAALWYSRPLWSGAAGSLQVVVLVGGPTGAALALRHLRLEGRSPTAMATGLWCLLCAPRTGTLHGYRARPSRPIRYGASLVIASGREEPLPSSGGEPEQLCLPLEPERTGQ